MAATDLVLAMTGASGAPYGLRLLDVLLRAGRTVHLTLSPAAVEVLHQETDRRVRLEAFEVGDLLGAVEELPGRGEDHHHPGFPAGLARGAVLTAGGGGGPRRPG